MTAFAPGRRSSDRDHTPREGRGVAFVAMLTRLADGTRVVIRRIRPGDKEMLARGLALLSEETRRRRFLGAKPHLTVAELRYLTEIDGHTHFARGGPRGPPRPRRGGGALRPLRRGSGNCRRGDSRRRPVAAAGPRSAARLHAGRCRARERVRRFSAAMLSDNPAPLALMHTLTERLSSGGHDRGVHEVVGDLAAYLPGVLPSPQHFPFSQLPSPRAGSRVRSSGSARGSRPSARPAARRA